jgi:hypothetical protein
MIGISCFSKGICTFNLFTSMNSPSLVFNLFLSKLEYSLFPLLLISIPLEIRILKGIHFSKDFTVSDYNIGGI